MRANPSYNSTAPQCQYAGVRPRYASFTRFLLHGRFRFSTAQIKSSQVLNPPVSDIEKCILSQEKRYAWRVSFPQRLRTVSRKTGSNNKNSQRTGKSTIQILSNANLNLRVKLDRIWFYVGENAILCGDWLGKMVSFQSRQIFPKELTNMRCSLFSCFCY
jgi:hypothetical protein